MLFALPSPAQADSPGDVLDPGLTARELSAIRQALVRETNPNHLVGFASTLSPQYPAAASLLFAKSALIELRPGAKQDALAQSAALATQKLAALIDRASGGAWSGARTVQWIAQPLDAGAAVGALINAATGWADASHAMQRLCPPAIHWPRFERMRAAADGSEAFGRLRARGIPDLNDLTCAAALALAQPIDAVTAQHAPLAARLQGLGFAEAYPLTAGPTLTARADDFRKAALWSASSQTPLRAALLAARRAELDRLANGDPAVEHEVKRAASDLVVDPSASLDDVPPEVRALARALVLEVAPDVRLLDPIAARAVLRPCPPPREPNPDRLRWVETQHREAARA